MILIAIQKKNYVYAYDENLREVINEPGELYNYTDKTVTLSRGNTKYIYDCSGKLLKLYPNDFIDNGVLCNCIV